MYSTGGTFDPPTRSREWVPGGAAGPSAYIDTRRMLSIMGERELRLHSES